MKYSKPLTDRELKAMRDFARHQNEGYSLAENIGAVLLCTATAALAWVACFVF